MKNPFRIFAIFILTIITAALAAAASNNDSKVDDSSQNLDKKYKVYISQLVKHPALDETTRGIIEGLKERGYINGSNIEIQTADAQGNVTLATQIAQNFVNSEPDIVVGVATIAAQSLYKYAREGRTKLVFASVTDPVAAKLAQSIDQPGGNTSGVSNYVDLVPQIEMFKKLVPDLQKLGFIYNPGEMNSLSLINKLKEECAKLEIELVTMAATKSSEVQQSVRNLAQKVDAIFVSNDNTALSALKTIANESTRQNIPVFVSDTDIVNQGALAALGPSQYDVGVKTAEMIDRVLKGEDISNISVEFPDKMELVINLKAAAAIGVVVPDEMIASASRVIE